MTQPTLFELVESRSPLPRWVRVPRSPLSCHAAYDLIVAGEFLAHIAHCGHPTALSPWQAWDAEDEPIPLPYGRKIGAAKAAVLTHLEIDPATLGAA